MAHLLLNSGLGLDLSHLEAAIQARRNANANLALLSHLPPATSLAGLSAPVPPPAAPTTMALAAASVPRMTIERPQLNPKISVEPPRVQESRSATASSVASSSDEEEDEDSPSVRIPQKRNPNDLSTAAPVTCLEDFVRMPISTTLNNLKMPAKAKGPSTQKSSLSVKDRPLRVFPSSYLPRDQDVVVDMAHYPNREFQNLIRQSLPNYLTANFQKRQSLINAIISTVSSNSGGHFIRYGSSQQAWMEVEKVHAERFTAQALQDAASNRSSFAAARAVQPSSGSNSPVPQDQRRASFAEKRGSFVAEKRRSSLEKRVSLSDKRRFSQQDPAEKRPSFGQKRGSFSEKRPSFTEKRSSFSIARPMQEIPVTFRKRPSQVVPLSMASTTEEVSDRSALQIKFKRPKTSSTPRKVSLETTRNPLEFLSQIAAMDSSESGDESLSHQ